MWNERYAEPGFAYGTEPNDFLHEVAGALVPPTRSSSRVSAAKGADLARRPPRIGFGLSNACPANDLHADHPRQPGTNFGLGALAPGSDVLCLAEGEGRNAVYLATLGHRVHAVDLSPVGLEKAEALARERRTSITTEVADLATFELGEERWDAIVSIWVHVPAAVRAPLHARVVRALRPGGHLVLEAYTPAQLELRTGGPPVPELLMTLDGLRDELTGLSFEIGREVVREVHEGKYHEGTSATVQVLARKP